MMRRVVITGIGIVSPIGNSIKEVLHSLREGRSGIAFEPKMKELGFRCQVVGRVKGLEPTGIGQRPLSTMSLVAKYVAVAALEALQDAGLSRHALEGPRVGAVVGTGGGGLNEVARGEGLLLAYKSPVRMGATGVAKIMTSTAALNLAAWLGIRGRCYSVSSACCTGTDSIGHGFELIREGLVDLCLCGAGEEMCWSPWAFGDAAGVMPAGFNDQPARACRPYDRDRAGMVVSEGAGVVVLEALEHARARGARVYAEVLGYGSANDGADMFEPNGRGLKRCLEQALAEARQGGPVRVDYINPHGAGTKVGDPVEVRVIREVFGEPSPLVSSTKGLNGHAQGAAGAHEAIFTLLMLQHGFVVPTVNLEQIAPECEGVRHVQALLEVPLETALTFNAGLGGTNACLIFRKL